MHKDSFPDLVTWIFLHLVVICVFLGGSVLLIAPLSLGYVNGPVEINWPGTLIMLLFPSGWLLLTYLGLSNILIREEILNKRQARLWGYCFSAFWVALLLKGVIDAQITYSKPGFTSYQPHLPPPAWWSHYLASAWLLLPYLVEILLIYWQARTRLLLRLPICLGWWLSGVLVLGSAQAFVTQSNDIVVLLPFFLLALSLIFGGLFYYLIGQRSRLFPLGAGKSVTL